MEKHGEKFRQPQMYSLEEIKSHSDVDDLWMVIYNKVYDVTQFVKDELHPGGAEVLIECGGCDATEAFDDVAHSNDATAMFEPYFIGDVIPSQHKVYNSVRQKLFEAEEKMKKLKLEKIQLAKERKRQKKIKNLMENLAILVLMLLALCTVLFYFILQAIKRTYNADNWMD